MTKPAHHFRVSVPSQKGISVSLAATAIRDALRGHADFFERRCSVRSLGAVPLAGWISVADRLPTHNYSVLGVVVDGPFVVAGDPDDRMRDVVSYVRSRGWLQFVGGEEDSDVVVTVTHWQDIPELP